MTAEIDIWRTAHFLIKRYGEDAAEQAMLRGNRMAAKGDVDGEAIWKRIQTAIQELDRREPQGRLN